jgi:protein phosphatase
MTRANLLIQPDNTVRLFDLEVAAVNGSPVSDDERGAEIGFLGEVLRRYCDVGAGSLGSFLLSVHKGEYMTPGSFGRAVEKRFDAFAAEAYSPLASGMTDVGLVRQLNEDNWGWRKLSDRATLYVVADGMGGHDGGEVASRVAVETICRVATEREQETPMGLDAVESLLDDAFQVANNTVKDEAEQRGSDMGTTLVAMLILDGRMGFIANVGDSRAYLHRGEELFQVSRDHSLVAKMVERGRITAEEARTHPHSNILLRTVGTERDIDIDIFRVELEPGDRVLLCSDGLWGEVEDRDLESLLNTYEDSRIASRELIRAAHHGGGKDNVTLVLVTVE